MTDPDSATGPKTDGTNRRVQARRSLEVQVDLASEHNFYTGFTENISSGGLFVATRDLLPIGSTFDMTFGLPNHPEPIRARCEVRWLRLEQPGASEFTPGMGVRFLSLSPEEQEAVNEFIRQRDTLFYDDD
jgi:type IV pilus assembly protein PilZ